MIHIKVIGSGCPKCIQIENLCREVIEENNIAACVENITVFGKSSCNGLVKTFQLVVNGRVLSERTVPAKSTLERWLIREISSSK
jgi:hypothetical protein